MPVTKQAIKRMKQDKVRTIRNRHYSSHMKSMIKLILGYINKGEKDKAEKIHSKVVKAIDTASKKNLIHKNNAAHKKSRVQKALNNMGTEKKSEKVEKKVVKKAEKVVKKEEESKKAETKEEKEEKEEKTK